MAASHFKMPKFRGKLLDKSCFFVLLLVMDSKLVWCQVDPQDKKSDSNGDKTDNMNDIVSSIDNPMNLSNDGVFGAKYSNSSTVVNNSTQNPVAGDIVKQVLAKKCSHQYSMTCLKLDVVKLMDHLESTESYQILPGISLMYAKNKRNESRANEIPTELAVSLVRDSNSTDKLDKFLFHKVDSYLSSLSINVRLIDSKVLGSVRKLSISALSNLFPTSDSETGRKKKDSYHAAAMWSAGTLAAVGFSALAAMSGKALMTSMIALLLAAMSAFKSHGGHGGKTSHYEIITKPAHYHDHDHLHSSSYTGAPYSYARHLVIAPADEERPPDEFKIPFRTYPLTPTYIPAHDK